MNNIRKVFLLILCGMSELLLFAQEPEYSVLFRENTALNIRLNISIREVRKETNDTTYMENVYLHYENETSVWDSVQVEIRTRGDFRLKECFFPPLRVKIRKKHAKGTLFEGNKALKLVLPCSKSRDNNALIVKEFLCYKLYEAITPYTFSTRLVQIDLWDNTGKRPKNYQLTGFFIEDDDLVADRFNATVKDNLTLHPLALHDTSAIRHDLFQYLIANIDWSTTYMHNEKIILTTDPLRYIPLTYDFDQSGFVNASYAVINPDFGMSNVRDRVYRGFCRKDDRVILYVRDQFIELEPSILATMENYHKMLSDKDYASLEKFVGEFFEVMKSDKLFRSEILDKCRTE
jgi:hypothetical protein